MTDVMRMELAPFGVKVIALTTGAVLTKSFDTRPFVTHPSTSICTPNKEKLGKAMSGDDLPGKIDVGLYARKVTNDLLNSRPCSAVWRGGAATLVWLITTFLLRTALDGQLLKQVGLDGLRANLKMG